MTPKCTPESIERKHRDQDFYIHLDKTASSYYTLRLQLQWFCKDEGHETCLVAKDGTHHKISEVQLTTWAGAIFQGTATVCQPPSSIPLLKDGECIDDYHRALAFYQCQEEDQEQSQPLKVSPNSVTPPRYFPRRDFKHLDHRPLDVDDLSFLSSEINSHVLWLNSWSRSLDISQEPNRKEWSIIPEQENRLFDILELGLEMARPCYSDEIISLSASLWPHLASLLNILSRGVYKFELQSKAISWLAHIRACTIPLELATFIPKDPTARDFMWWTLDAVLSDPIRDKSYAVASRMTYTLGPELALSPYTPKTRALGKALAAVLQLEMFYTPCYPDQLYQIDELVTARARRQDPKVNSYYRPWELLIFESLGRHCAELRLFNRSNSGLVGLLSAFKDFTARSVISDEDAEAIGDIIQAISIIGPRYMEVILECPKMATVLLRFLKPGIFPVIPQSKYYGIILLERILAQDRHSVKEIRKLDWRPTITFYANYKEPTSSSKEDPGLDDVSSKWLLSLQWDARTAAKSIHEHITKKPKCKKRLANMLSRSMTLRPVFGLFTLVKTLPFQTYSFDDIIDEIPIRVCPCDY